MKAGIGGPSIAAEQRLGHKPRWGSEHEASVAIERHPDRVVDSRVVTFLVSLFPPSLGQEEESERSSQLPLCVVHVHKRSFETCERTPSRASREHGAGEPDVDPFDSCA